MDTKVHYKLYKAGKHWVSALVVGTIAFGLAPTSLPSFNTHAVTTTTTASTQNTLNLADYGADKSGQTDSTVAFQKAIAAAKQSGVPTTIVMPKGEYALFPDKADQRELFVSNTTGADTNYKDKRLGVLLEDAENITIDGQGSTLMFHGKMTTLAAINSKNITFKNLNVNFKVPTVVDLLVKSKSGNTVTYQVPAENPYRVSGNTVTWLGGKNPYTGDEYWTAQNGMQYTQINDTKTGKTWRGDQPVFSGVQKIEEVGNHLLKFTYTGNKDSIQPGYSYQMRNTVRDTPGMFFWKSENIQLENVNVNFLHGFGVVVQSSTDFSMDNVHFVKPKDSIGTTVGYADFIQVSGSKGKVSITNSSFENPHDDPINIHGTFLQVTERISSNKVKVRYMHNETAGFPSFFVGDEVEFMTKGNMIPVTGSNAKVTAVDGPDGTSHDKSLTDITLTFDRDLPAEIQPGQHVVENVTYTPEVSIKNNTFKSVPTRGILVTTRKPVDIAGNTFHGMGMAAIYISNDAQGWYESGPVRDVKIHDNKFYGDGGNAPLVFIEPTNPTVSTDQTVHKNILIDHNQFFVKNSAVLDAKSVDNLQFTNNQINPIAPAINVTTQLDNNKLTVGGKVRLETKVNGAELKQALFNFNGDKDVRLAGNQFGYGLNLKGRFINQTAADIVQTNQSSILFNGGDNMTPAYDKLDYDISDSTIAKVLPSGHVVGLKTGSVTITPYIMTGGKRYNAKPVALTVSPATNTHPDLRNTTILGPDQATDSANYTLSNDKLTDVKWSCTNTNGKGAALATIDDTGHLRAKGYGFVTITATFPDQQTLTKTILVGQAGVALAPDFSIIRPNMGAVKTDTTGVTVLAGKGSLWSTGTSENLFLHQIKNGDQLTVTMKVSGKTQSAYDEAGLMLYKDDDNYVLVNRKHANGNPAIHLVTEQNGQPDEHIQTKDIAATDIYYKLVKSGDHITAYYSDQADGNWQKIGETDNAKLGQDFKVGFMAAGGSKTNTPFTFSNLTINDVPVALTGKPDLPVVETFTSHLSDRTAVATLTGQHLDATTYQWYVSDTADGNYLPIPNATAKQLKIDESYDGLFLKVSALPASQTGGLGTPLMTKTALAVHLGSEPGPSPEPSPKPDPLPDENQKPTYPTKPKDEVTVNGSFKAPKNRETAIYNAKGRRVGTLQPDINYVYTATATVDGHPCYKIASSRYVRQADIILISNRINKPGVATVSKHAITKYNGDGDRVVDQVLSAGSKWKVFYQIRINGTLFYNLGGDQFVRATDVTFVANNQPIAFRKIGTVKYVPHYGIQVWTKAHKAVKTASGANKKLRHGSQWKVFSKMMINGVLHYNVGGDQWVDSRYMTIK